METVETAVPPLKGRKSPRFGHLGMWSISLGPGSSIPGPRLIICILDQNKKQVRRLEQVRGNHIEPGYVDFFESHRCRPATSEYPLVDIDENGQIVSVLHPNFTSRMDQSTYLAILADWVTKYGKPEYAL